MKQLIWLMLLAMPFFVLSQNVDLVHDNSGVKWTEGLSWDSVIEKAKKENKFIFVDCYATWCGPCKQMDKEVYTQKNVGEILNPKFISVKVQMDKTEKDNEITKKWYPVVKEFREQYSIEGYPSYLFFNSAGMLAYKALGFQDAKVFVETVKEALTDPEARYQRDVEKFKSGQLVYTYMPDLARQAKDKKDEELATEIAKHFKEKYLDKLNDDEVFTKGNLGFLMVFQPELLKTNDRYFQFFYQHPDLADSIIDGAIYGRKHIAKLITQLVITKEEIGDKIYKDGKPITDPKPNWSAIHKSVKKKYGRKYYDLLFPDNEIRFYEEAQDWRNAMKYVNVRIKKYPPQSNGFSFGVQYGDVWTVNHWAWNFFLQCNDKELLQKALAWSDLAISLEDKPSTKANYIDTKANLLYKIGNIKEAIELEEKALELSKDVTYTHDNIQKVLTKMKAGLPTWN
jgi:thioredoxin-related protein